MTSLERLERHVFYKVLAEELARYLESDAYLTGETTPQQAKVREAILKSEIARFSGRSAYHLKATREF